MSTRRNFVKSTTLLSLMSAYKGSLRSSSLLTDEGVDWKSVRSNFPIVKWKKMYLNSGSAGVLPLPVSEYLEQMTRYLSAKAPYEVWNEWQDIKKNNIRRLAEMITCDTNEIQIVRNTTEALNMIIYGLSLQRGDEVIVAEHDYGFAVNAWENRALRDGILIKKLNLSLPSTNAEIIEKYREAITPKTKAVHLTHITHRLGLRLPTKEITSWAHQFGAEVILDGAHVLGQTSIDLSDIDCDYFASSLHKWLNAPLGTGLLFVKKRKIQGLYNHPSSYLSASDSINKFEHLGTRAWQNEIGVSAALDFLDHISLQKKEERLQYLKEYWTSKVRDIEKATVLTPVELPRSAAIAVVSLRGLSSAELKNILNVTYDIHVKSVSSSWGNGIRVSPNIFTLEEDLDYLVEAIKRIAKSI